jgi:hypothetical protein
VHPVQVVTERGMQAALVAEVAEDVAGQRQVPGKVTLGGAHDVVRERTGSRVVSRQVGGVDRDPISHAVIVPYRAHPRG